MRGGFLLGVWLTVRTVGSNVNLEMLERYKKEYPLEKEEVVV